MADGSHAATALCPDKSIGLSNLAPSPDLDRNFASNQHGTEAPYCRRSVSLSVSTGQQPARQQVRGSPIPASKPDHSCISKMSPSHPSNPPIRLFGA